MEGTSRHRPDGCREMLRLAPGIRTRSVIQVFCAARQSAQIKLVATSLVDPRLTTDECRVGDGTVERKLQLQYPPLLVRGLGAGVSEWIRTAFRATFVAVRRRHTENAHDLA